MANCEESAKVYILENMRCIITKGDINTNHMRDLIRVYDDNAQPIPDENIDDETPAGDRRPRALLEPRNAGDNASTPVILYRKEDGLPDNAIKNPSIATRVN